MTTVGDEDFHIFEANPCKSFGSFVARRMDNTRNYTERKFYQKYNDIVPWYSIVPLKDSSKYIEIFYAEIGQEKSKLEEKYKNLSKSVKIYKKNLKIWGKAWKFDKKNEKILPKSWQKI